MSAINKYLAKITDDSHLKKRQRNRRLQCIWGTITLFKTGTFQERSL